MKTQGVLVTLVLFMIFIVGCSKENSTTLNSGEEVPSNDTSKWEEGYSQVKDINSFKADETIYIMEDDVYVEAFKILELQENFVHENGYVSDKAMLIDTGDETFWKDIDETLKTSLSEYGLKYYTKSMKYGG